MNRVWNVVTCILIVAGVPLLAWSGYSLAADTYALWTRGVEKRVSVIRLDGGHTGRGGTVFGYIIEIDGRRVRHEFRAPLSVGETVSVLMVPEDPRLIAVGDRSSTPFAIFASLIGGDIIATMVLIMFAFMTVAVPRTLWMFIKGRKVLRSGWI
jgi:hypothetical protein